MGEERNRKGLNGRKDNTSVLKGGAMTDTYSTSYNYGKMNSSRTESKLGKILIIVLIVVLIVVAVTAALSYFKVI